MIVPALPVPMWVLTPLNTIHKGAKFHKGRGLASGLLNRLLKQTAKESLRYEAQLCLLAHI